MNVRERLWVVSNSKGWVVQPAHESRAEAEQHARALSDEYGDQYTVVEYTRANELALDKAAVRAAWETLRDALDEVDKCPTWETCPISDLVRAEQRAINADRNLYDLGAYLRVLQLHL